MAGRLALIAAGGTGGHMFPAQALAEELLAGGWRVTLADARQEVTFRCGDGVWTATTCETAR